MGTRITRTDTGGRFLFDELTFNRPRANKSAYILIFKPGWVATARSTPISSTLFLPSQMTLTQSLSRGPGRQQRKTIGWPEDLVATLGPSEFTRSDEVFETLTIAGHRFCEPIGTEASVAAMKHALFIAKTFTERERVRATCALAAEHARLAASGSAWPFDCNNLFFKHQPTDQVLAAEAEIEAQHNHMSK
jgi:hypothetical protein